MSDTSTSSNPLDLTSSVFSKSGDDIHINAGNPFVPDCLAKIPHRPPLPIVSLTIKYHCSNNGFTMHYLQRCSSLDRAVPDMEDKTICVDDLNKKSDISVAGTLLDILIFMYLGQIPMAMQFVGLVSRGRGFKS